MSTYRDHAEFLEGDGHDAKPDRITVTVSDAVTGQVLGTQVIYDDYVLVCSGLCYLAHTQAHANGTHVLTVKNAAPPRHP